jgi:hypothetical protein
MYRPFNKNLTCLILPLKERVVDHLPCKIAPEFEESRASIGVPPEDKVPQGKECIRFCEREDE